MKENRPVATLSAEGWVSDPRAKLIKLLQYMVYNESDQSDYFEVFDIHRYIRKHVKSPGTLASTLEIQLSMYLEKYFDEVQVRILWVPTANSEEYNLDLEIQALDQGKHATLGRRLDIKDGIFIPNDKDDVPQ